MDNLLIPSCRVAFSALIHDIGKFAERAKIEISVTEKENNIHIFCPKNYDTQQPTHIHAAYTGVAIDKIEKYCPPLAHEDTFPFQSDAQDDSIIGAAAGHHNPHTPLQNIICTADRLASAFERTQYEEYNQTPEKDYQTARLLSLFEKINFPEKQEQNFEYRHPLSALSAQSIFPELKQQLTKETATMEYRHLWELFLQDIKQIKNKNTWDLWLDNFDTLYMIYTQNIPSASYHDMPDVSLYDHSKTTAALATALWRYHYETKQTNVSLNDLQEQQDQAKFLLIQGDVSGIQDFIFDVGKHTSKYAYKILRARSFMVSLFSECAALKILQTLELPSTSQIINAAGKFMILAPNTDNTKAKIEQIKHDLDTWFLQRYYGKINVGIAVLEASQQDFENKNFMQLQQKLSQKLSQAKLQKFDLCHSHAGVESDFFDNYNKDLGLCCFEQTHPAEQAVDEEENSFACKACLDLLHLGEELTKSRTLVLASEQTEHGFKTDILGFYVGWRPLENMLRCWDISLPDADADHSLFNGCARRFINAYVPRFEKDDNFNPIYQNCAEPQEGKIKTFEHLAVENCQYEEGRLKIKSALMILKGDIDNLGLLFHQVKSPTFATMAQLSRQLNNFFCVWLPWFCKSNKAAHNIYTVFAGGDDFYLIAPWIDGINFVPQLKAHFDDFVCRQKFPTFSIGMYMTRSGSELLSASEKVEDALNEAKARQDVSGALVKNAVCCFNQTVSHEEYQDLVRLASRFDTIKFAKDKTLSIAFVYSLLSLCQQAAEADDINLPNTKHSLSAALWRSRLVYRTTRFVETAAGSDLSDEEKQSIIKEITTDIGNAIAQYKNHYIIALYLWLYQQREN